MENAYQVLYDIVLAILGVFMLLCLVRAIRGPKVADRLLAVNMTGTLTVIIICILSLVLNQGYLTDVATVYVMLSFLAVVLLTRIRIGLWREKHENDQTKAAVPEEVKHDVP